MTGRHPAHRRMTRRRSAASRSHPRPTALCTGPPPEVCRRPMHFRARPTAPGLVVAGSRIRYKKEDLMALRSSPLAQATLSQLAHIPGITLGQPATVSTAPSPAPPLPDQPFCFRRRLPPRQQSLRKVWTEQRPSLALADHAAVQTRSAATTRRCLTWSDGHRKRGPAAATPHSCTARASRLFPSHSRRTRIAGSRCGRHDCLISTPVLAK